MAQNDSFQQYLNESNYSPTPISRKLAGSSEGVGGLSEGIGRTAKLGVELYDAYDSYKTRQVMGKIDEDIEKLNEEYQLGSPTKRRDTINEAAQIQTADEIYKYKLPSMESGLDTGEEIDAVLSKVPEGLQEKLDFLDRAKNQGRIPAKEFALRAKAITQEAVAKNPHLTREIVSRLSLKLSASGIQERMALDADYDEAIQKQEDWEIKQLDEGLTKVGRSILEFRDTRTGRINKAKATEVMLNDLEDKRVYDTIKMEAEKKKIYTEKELQQIKDSGGIPKVLNVFRQNYWSAASEALSASSNVDEQMTALTFNIDKINGDLEQSFGHLSYDPDIRRSLDEAKKSGEVVLKAVSSASTQEGRKQQLNNITAINSALDNEAIRKVIPNIEAWKLQQQALQNPYLSQLVKGQDYEAINNLMLDNALKLKGLGVTATDLTVNPAIGVSNATAFNTTQINSISSGNTDPQSIDAFNTHVSSRAKVVTGLSNAQQRFVEAQQFLTELADPKTAIAAQTLNSDVKQEAINLISGQSQPLAMSLKKLEAKDVAFGFSPEGTLIVTNNKATSQELTNFVDRVNVNLKAYANLQGMSVKNASKEYFTNLYGDVFNPKDIPNPIDEYKEKAVSLLTTIKKQPTVKKQSIFGEEGDVNIVGQISTQNITTPYAMTVDSTRRPGFGVAPIDYTKSGKELEKEKDRFRQDYLTQMLVKYNGDERKAYAAFNAGTEVVDKAITTAAKSGEPTMWAAKLPTQYGKLLQDSKVVISDKDNALATYIPSLRAKQEQIKTVNPQSYDEIFDKGSSVALAQDIQKDLASQGINFTWNAIHQYMEQNNLMPNQATVSNLPTGELTPDQEVDQTLANLVKESKMSKVSEGTKQYAQAQKEAQAQRQRLYNKYINPTADLISDGYGLYKGLILDIATLPNKAAWDWDNYRATGELKRKGETQGMTPNLDKARKDFGGEDIPIKQKYADLYTQDKQSLENGTITQEEFRNRASSNNRKLKKELAAKGLQ